MQYDEEKIIERIASGDEAPRSPGNRLVPFESVLREALEAVAVLKNGRWYVKPEELKP